MNTKDTSSSTMQQDKMPIIHVLQGAYTWLSFHPGAGQGSADWLDPTLIYASNPYKVISRGNVFHGLWISE